MSQIAVAYARFSSDNQHEESIIAQLRAIREYADKNDIIIVKEYTDEARSATTDDRPSFLKMIKDITSDLLAADYVLVHKLDRFARNRYDSAIYRRELSIHGARLVAVAQPMGEGPESIILESIIEAMAEYYSKNLSHEVKSKMKEHAQKAKHLGGVPPLGYDVTEIDGEKKYTINEKEAETVKIIFEMTAQGHGYSGIIDKLNAEGHKTRRGGSFGKNSLYEILRNEKYIGTYVFNKAASKKLGKRNTHAHKNSDEIIKIPGAIPAIVSEETWSVVRKRMESRKRGPSLRRRSNTLYILTGKTICGECGAAYTGKSQTAGRSKKKYNLYGCSAKKQKRNNCANKDIRKELLENIVLDRIQETCNPANIKKVSSRIEQAYKELSEKATTETTKTKKAIAGIVKKMDRLFGLVEGGNANPSTVGPRLDMLAKEKETKENRLLKLQATSRAPFTRQQVMNYLRTGNAFSDRRNEMECKKIVDIYVYQVIIYQDSIKVLFNLSLEGDGGDALNDGGGGGNRTLSASVTKEEIFSKRFRKI